MTAACASTQLTVLRIKRKRTDGPLNALVVHNVDVKKTKVQGGCNGTSDENHLFRYSGTVDEEQINSTRHTVKNFQTIYQQVVRHDGDAGREKIKRRGEQKAHQKLCRYRIVTEKRKDSDSIDGSPLLEEDEIERMYKIFDVVAEDDNGNALSMSDDKIVSEEERIFCNNVEMIREKLHISENAPKVQSAEAEYVYDLYLAPGGAIVMADNEIINVEEYQEYDYDSYEHTHYDANAEEYYEDEDDENDENNWRNEYPEDESDSDSGNELKERWGGDYSANSYCGDYGVNASTDEDYMYNGYRYGATRLQLDPYAKETQEECYYTVASDDPAGATRLQLDPYAKETQEECYYTVASDDPADET